MKAVGKRPEYQENILVDWRGLQHVFKNKNKLFSIIPRPHNLRGPSSTTYYNHQQFSTWVSIIHFSHKRPACHLQVDHWCYQCIPWLILLSILQIVFTSSLSYDCLPLVLQLRSTSYLSPFLWFHFRICSPVLFRTNTSSILITVQFNL